MAKDQLIVAGGMPSNGTAETYGMALLALISVIAEATGHDVPTLLTAVEVAHIRVKAEAKKRGN